MRTLYLVATPIGNLEDITLRALRILREASLIAAEDTRHTRRLLNHFAITTPLISYHEHSPQTRLTLLLESLEVGDIALVSDAGTPTFSDPGQGLVRAAIVAGHAVVPVPGATAAISALIASGLPTDHFTFLGFLPRKSRERRALLEHVGALPYTLILYEAPHRLLVCLDDLLAVLGDRQIALARELTKLHEDIQRGPLAELRGRYGDGTSPRGEYVIVVAGATSWLPGEHSAGGVATTTPSLSAESAARAKLATLLASGKGTREAAAETAKTAGIPRRDAYRLALEMAAQESDC